MIETNVRFFPKLFPKLVKEAQTMFSLKASHQGQQVTFQLKSHVAKNLSLENFRVLHNACGGEMALIEDNSLLRCTMCKKSMEFNPKETENLGTLLERFTLEEKTNTNTRPAALSGGCCI